MVSGAWRPLLGIFTDLVPLTRVLVTSGVRRRPTASRVDETPFTALSDSGEDAAERALAEALGSLAPNSIVVGLDHERGVLVSHRLRHERVAVGGGACSRGARAARGRRRARPLARGPRGARGGGHTATLVLLLIAEGTHRQPFGDLAWSSASSRSPARSRYLRFGRELDGHDARPWSVCSSPARRVALLACVGVLLMRDALDRLHYVGALAAAALLVGAAVLVRESFSLIGDRAVLVAVLVLVTTPVLTHATGAGHPQARERR